MSECCLTPNSQLFCSNIIVRINKIQQDARFVLDHLIELDLYSARPPHCVRPV
jgi:hypothetical protein